MLIILNLKLSTLLSFWIRDWFLRLERLESKGPRIKRRLSVKRKNAATQRKIGGIKEVTLYLLFALTTVVIGAKYPREGHSFGPCVRTFWQPETENSSPGVPTTRGNSVWETT